MKDFFLELKLINKDNVTSFAVPGVWALFGKRIEDKDKKWYCLQVAETSCIRNEIETDMQFIDSELDESGDEISYVNQFGEFLFSYRVYPSSRKYLYSKYIKEQFGDFQFVFICEKKDKSIRRSIEKEFAYRTNAVYWRNGGPFKKGEVIDYESRKCITEDIPDNGDVSRKIIIPFVERYNLQWKKEKTLAMYRV